MNLPRDARDNPNKRWIVSVAMISEGVDIKRLRVLVYLPYATTELAFRQSLGRVVRSMGHDDMSSAYIIMPTLKKLEDHARKVENEMGPAHRKGSGQPKFKVCPSCENKCSLGATECNECGHEFPENKPNEFECDTCKTLNPAGAESCYALDTTTTGQFQHRGGGVYKMCSRFFQTRRNRRRYLAHYVAQRVYRSAWQHHLSSSIDAMLHALPSNPANAFDASWHRVV